MNIELNLYNPSSFTDIMIYLSIFFIPFKTASYKIGKTIKNITIKVDIVDLTNISNNIEITAVGTTFMMPIAGDNIFSTALKNPDNVPKIMAKINATNIVNKLIPKLVNIAI